MSDTSLLAGLGFAFEPVSLALKTDKAGQGRRRSAERPREPARPGSGDGGACAAPQQAAPSPKGVSFNLNARGPGPTYGAPQQQQAETNQQPGSNDAGRVPPGAAGLAALKLASLWRRAAAGVAAPPAPAAVDGGGAAAAAVPEHATVAADAPGGDGALLDRIQRLLAGCSAGMLEDPPPAVLPPQHIMVGMPVLALPPPAYDAAAAGTSQSSSSAGVQGEQLIGAYHPGPVGSGGGAAAAAADDAVAAAESAEAVLPSDCSSVPRTLGEAMQCLGLLAPAGRGEEDAALGTSSRASDDTQPQWVRLRAVQLVLAAKRQAAAAAELLPLVRRLRQVSCHLEFHRANLQRSRSRSPGRGSSSPRAAAPPGPWLSGRSSSLDSKHRSSRSSSPGPGRPKVGADTGKMLARAPLPSLMRPPLLSLPLRRPHPSSCALHRWRAPGPRSRTYRCSYWAACSRSCSSSWGWPCCARQWWRPGCGAGCWNMRQPKLQRTLPMQRCWSGMRRRYPARSRRQMPQLSLHAWSCGGSRRSLRRGGSGQPTARGGSARWREGSWHCAVACCRPPCSTGAAPASSAWWRGCRTRWRPGGWRLGAGAAC